jgi:hypothetical protein
MAKGSSAKPSSGGPLEQHPLVSARPVDGRGRPEPGFELVGFPADSNSPGTQRLYLNPALTYYAEFAVDDILASAVVPAEQSPWPGQSAVSVIVKADAPVDYTWAGRASARDEFDLDIRFEARRYHGDMRVNTECCASYSCPTRWSHCNQESCGCR